VSTLKFGLTEARKLRPILNPEWGKLDKDLLPELDEVCVEVLEAAVDIAEERTKYACLAQIYWTMEDGSLKSFDPAAEKVAIVYSTQGEADKAAGMFQGGGSSKELLRTWVLPVWHESPNEWKKARRKAQEAAEEALRGGSQADRLAAKMQAEEVGHCDGRANDKNGEPKSCIRPTDHPGSHWA